MTLPLAEFPEGMASSTSIIDNVPLETHEAVASLAETRRRLMDEIGRVIVGQHRVLDQVLTALFARGHCVMKGVPGLAKTMIVSSLARTMSLRFKRIQFTPDLMPTDITGTMVLSGDDRRYREFAFRSGPIFTNILLADEIKRTPPRTQAALLEAMQELSVSVAGKTRPLPVPFLVLATQNPIEQEGTYLCGSVVVPQQPAQALAAADPALGLSDRFVGHDQLVVEALMIPFSVVVCNKLFDGSPQLSLAEEDHLVQTFGLDRSDESLRVWIQIRTSRGQLDHLHAGGLEDLCKTLREQWAAIMDQISLTLQKAFEGIGQIPSRLLHPWSIGFRHDASDFHNTRG